MSTRERLHATCVELGGRAVLLLGPPGSGKSDLALRLIDQGASLVADDQTELTCSDGKLYASAPSVLAGLLEIRGFGIVKTAFVARAEVALVVKLAPVEAIERLPEQEAASFRLLEVVLPMTMIDPASPSAAARARAAVSRV